MDLFGWKPSTAETQLLTVLAGLMTVIVAWLTRGGRKADEQTKSKETIEGPETQGMSMRDLVVETFRKSGSAEESAAAARLASGKLQETTEELGKAVKKGHEALTGEVARLDGRIDGVFKVATEAITIARAAAGTRSADETVRQAAVATPPMGVSAITEG